MLNDFLFLSIVPFKSHLHPSPSPLHHIPHQHRPSPSDTSQFKKLLTPGKISLSLILGNLTDPSVYTFLKTLSPTLHIVRGDFDVDAPHLPPSKVVQHGNLRIGLLHGHTIVPPGDADALLATARHMDVDVLCWGGTHRFEAWEAEGKFFVNPGSATGAVSSGWGWGGGKFGVGGVEGPSGGDGSEKKDKKAEKGDGVDSTEDPVPSFVLMDVQGDVLVLYVYQLRDDSVTVEKVSYRKERKEEAAPAGQAQGQASPTTATAAAAT
jgi:vacuolar protein sorting-associated protein 29